MSMYRRLGVLIGVPLILGLLIAGSVEGGPSGTIIYVDCDAAGSNDGSSWINAYTDLQDALDVAAPGDEIWVAEGVYCPASDAADRTASFELQDGVGLYGGFAGMEGERDQRDWEANLTVLSGDLDRNDETDGNGVVTDTVNITGNNAYHVVMGGGVTETAVLDGFTVTAGRANGAEWLRDSGGGVHNVESSPQVTNVALIGNYAHVRGGGMYNSNSRPTLTNVTFSGNHAQYGGGLRNTSSSPTLTNVAFTTNQAAASGGAMYNHLSSPTLRDVTFSGNEAKWGGGMYSGGGSNPTLTNTTFTDNKGTESGGGMYNYLSSPTLEDVTFTGNRAELRGGGMRNGGSSPTLTDVTFSENHAEQGGGMYNEDESSPTLTEVTFSDNGAKWGGGMYNTQVSTPTLTNVTFAGNQAEILGGGMDNYNRSTVTLVNVAFMGNKAGSGGGMHNEFSSSSTLTNVTFSGNRADRLGGGMYNNLATVTVVNAILWGNSPDNIANTERTSATVTYSDVGLPTGVYTGTGNINSDPLFVDPVSASQAPTTAGDYRLREGSPVVDAGTNDVVTVDTDMDGYPRILDGDVDGSSVVDMGGYEFMPTTLVINYACGKPGSFFALEGAGFPPDVVACVTINGNTLTDTLHVDASGGLGFVLDTSAAETGRYLVTAKANRSANAAFTLDPGAPLRLQEGGGPILAVPSGIAFNQFVYLPLIQK